MPVRDASQRFSSRVANYVRYRPGYPSAVLELLKQDCGLTPAAVIADVASGTGIFARIVLENGNRAFGIEPWFDRDQARGEFVRILNPGGWVVLLWNERLTDSIPFLRDYEKLLLTFGADYQEVRHERTTAEIDPFFAPSPFQARVFENRQELGFPALEGRLLSSSYTRQGEDPRHAPMLAELRRIFDAHKVGGRVSFEYATRVYYGQLA